MHANLWLYHISFSYLKTVTCKDVVCTSSVLILGDTRSINNKAYLIWNQQRKSVLQVDLGCDYDCIHMIHSHVHTEKSHLFSFLVSFSSYEVTRSPTSSWMALNNVQCHKLSFDITTWSKPDPNSFSPGFKTWSFSANTTTAEIGAIFAWLKQKTDTQTNWQQINIFGGGT